jgi:hypothetical protein
MAFRQPALGDGDGENKRKLMFCRVAEVGRGRGVSHRRRGVDRFKVDDLTLCYLLTATRRGLESVGSFSQPWKIPR